MILAGIFLLSFNIISRYNLVTQNTRMHNYASGGTKITHVQSKLILTLLLNVYRFIIISLRFKCTRERIVVYFPIFSVAYLRPGMYLLILIFVLWQRVYY